MAIRLRRYGDTMESMGIEIAPSSERMVSAMSKYSSDVLIFLYLVECGLLTERKGDKVLASIYGAAYFMALEREQDDNESKDFATARQLEFKFKQSSTM